MTGGTIRNPDRLAAIVIAAFLVARLVFALLLGPGVDESYTLAIARTPALSYFDHPPLHQWIAHAAASAFGEGVGARLPFLALFAVTGWIYYRMTADLFGPRAGIVAVFGLDAAPFFFASAGTWIVPDGPLLFGLAAAAWALAKLFFGPGSGRATEWALWLAAGGALGLAGLSKYSAALAVVGVLAFVAISPGRRRWFADPAPYAAAALALVMIAPVVVWNARHGWASFGFQGARGAAGSGLKPAQVAAMALGEVAYLSPWLAAPLGLGLIAAWRKRADERRLFLLCLALPPIVVFTLTPLWGARGLPHWAMPGWFFVFALMGAWVEDAHVTDRALGRWGLACAGALAAIAGLVAVEARTGWPLRLLAPGAADPTLEALDWGALRDAPAMRPRPAFVLAQKWSDAGKIALALGPETPVFVISDDPRGWAFVAGESGLAGRDGVLATRAPDAAAAAARAAEIAGSLGPPQAFLLTRGGEPAIALTLIPVHRLTRALPLPYPGAPGG
ncbi:dolichyl-phosphate-mannose-protein mannosyltransferase [Roseiarcus fermentans]|uniref:Dolichyl-phosphate-mannose-protein mannosyltransferase n=1 Tax=Roseiarcus fermentans TaxID=1473586 RepID=A0A366FRF8_9HYPH|nr:glycosyltransferase family 39 protein [Roseiarcus fermentans]RBP17157.1 dolichyl-phosphate-mannose-protein mannosyltransferase [Roseiarcus fermentans]